MPRSQTVTVPLQVNQYTYMYLYGWPDGQIGYRALPYLIPTYLAYISIGRGREQQYVSVSKPYHPPCEGKREYPVGWGGDGTRRGWPCMVSFFLYECV